MIAGGAGCSGVSDLHGQTVLFTGKTHVYGQWETKAECGRRVRQSGGQWVPDESRKVTLLVMGELTNQIVTDPVLQYSAKILYVHDQRLLGHHICAVDGPGFTDLLSGRPARCLTLQHGTKPKSVRVSQGKEIFH